MRRPGMILDIEPITYVAAVAIDRQWFASQGTDDDQRNKLFGEMIRSVIVGAVCDQYRQSIGAAPGANQMIRSEEHTSELQSLMRISYAVFCLKNKKTT